MNRTELTFLQNVINKSVDLIRNEINNDALKQNGWVEIKAYDGINKHPVFATVSRLNTGNQQFQNKE